jgi:hypothetical protein
VIEAGVCLALILIGIRRWFHTAVRPLDSDELRDVRRLSERIRRDGAFPFDYRN